MFLMKLSYKISQLKKTHPKITISKHSAINCGNSSEYKTN